MRLYRILPFILSGLLLFCIALFTDGTGDSGDSINHYLHSQYAFKHPWLFIDLWNKPVFTLLSSIFAQAGFTGIKVFNALCGIVSLAILLKIAGRIEKKETWIISFLFLGSAFHLTVLNSGLTEPLFDALLLISIYLLVSGRTMAAAVLISFLPFARQEGYLLLAFFLPWFVLQRRLPEAFLLMTGHVLVTVAGLFHHGDVLWVFRNNPNAVMGHYGHGGWFDYFFKLAFIFGKPVYALLGIGVVAYVITFFRKGSGKQLLFDPAALPLWCFFIVVASHALFWKFGLFKSFGMERNILSVFGCGVLVAFTGWTFIMRKLKSRYARGMLKCLIPAVILIYPFFPGKYDVVMARDFSLKPDQRLIQSAADSLMPEFRGKKIFTSHPYVNYLLDRDPFNRDSVGGIHDYRMGSEGSALVIWDDWFAVMEGGISLEQLANDSSLSLLYDSKTSAPRICVFGEQ